MPTGGLGRAQNLHNQMKIIFYMWKKNNLRVVRRKQPCAIPLSHSYNLCEDKLFSFMCFVSLKA